MKKRSFVTTLPRLWRWVAETRGVFPARPADATDVIQSPPVVVPANGAEPKLSPRIRRAVAQATIDVAENFVRARPSALAGARVAAVLRWPRVDGAEVRVFYDADAYRGFERAARPDTRWIPMPAERSLVETERLRLPDGFVARGYLERATARTPSAPPPEAEVWVIGEMPG